MKWWQRIDPIEPFLRARARRKAAAPPKPWQVDPAAAFELARKRIRAAKRLDRFFGHVSLSGYRHDLVLSDLTALTELPEEIAELRNLQRLYLGRVSKGRTHLPGAGKVRNISILANLTSLRSLYLAGLPIDDVAPIGKMVSLEQLDIEDTKVENIVPISTLPKLRSLYLKGSAVSDLKPIAGLPKSKDGLRFTIRSTPGFDKDPRLAYLVKTLKDESNEEIIQYLQGLHPAFNEAGEISSSPKTMTESLEAAAPVKFVSIAGKIEAVNQLSLSTEALAETDKRLKALRIMADDLLQEAVQRQVSQATVSRISRYRERVHEQEPLFIVLDAAMSFIRGALSDPYWKESTDQGFIEGCKAFVANHDAMRPYFVREVGEIAEVSSSSDDIVGQKDRIKEHVEEAIDFTGQEKFADDVGPSVRDALLAVRDYVDALTSRSEPGLLRRALIGIAGTLAALSAAATLHTWAVSQLGKQFMTGLGGILESLLQLLF